jgi:hypothetical protein
MTTAILCSRERGCEHVELREPSLIDRIEQLLRRAKGRKFTLREIMAQLGLEAGNTGEPWQNVCRVAGELAKLQEFERISFKAPDAHWIEPPRRDPITGELVEVRP